MKKEITSEIHSPKRNGSWSKEKKHEIIDTDNFYTLSLKNPKRIDLLPTPVIHD